MTPDLEELERLLNGPASAHGRAFDLGMWMIANGEALIAKAREVEGLRAEVAAKSAAAAKQISDLAMQVGELRAENERLRALLAECPARHSMHGCPSAARAALGEAK